MVRNMARGGKSQIPFWEATFEVNYFLPNAVIPSSKRTFGPFDFLRANKISATRVSPKGVKSNAHKKKFISSVENIPVRSVKW